VREREQVSGIAADALAPPNSLVSQRSGNIVPSIAGVCAA